MYQVTAAERRYIERLLEKAPNQATRMEVMGSIDDDDFGGLIFELGVVEFYKDVKDERRFNAPYEKIGKRYWRSVKGQLHELVCGNSRAYAEERRAIRAEGRDIVIVLVPMIVAALHLPVASVGVAIMLALIIAKVGVRAFCEEFKPATAKRKEARPSPRGKGRAD